MPKNEKDALRLGEDREEYCPNRKLWGEKDSFKKGVCLTSFVK